MHKTEAGSEPLTMFRACLIRWRACCYALAAVLPSKHFLCATVFLFDVQPLGGLFQFSAVQAVITCRRIGRCLFLVDALNGRHLAIGCKACAFKHKRGTRRAFYINLPQLVLVLR